MDALAVRLRMLRKRCHKTLKEVSGAAGISLPFLSDIERGRTMPSLETLEAIAEVYGLTVGEVLVNVRIRPVEPDECLTIEQSRQLMEEMAWIKRKEFEQSLGL